MFAAHALRLAQSIQRRPGYTVDQAGDPNAMPQPGQAYPLRVKVHAIDEENLDPVPNLTRHSIGVVPGPVEPAVSRTAAGDHLP